MVLQKIVLAITLCKGNYLEPLKGPVEHWAEVPFAVLLRVIF